MKTNYWNENLHQWTKSKQPDAQTRSHGSSRRAWEKFSIGRNEYYGKHLNKRDKAKIVIGKIIPLCIFSIILAPFSVPLLLATGGYRKCARWIKEVKHGKTIEYIVNVRFPSDSISQPPPLPLESNLNSDILSKILLSPDFSSLDEGRNYLQTLACVSKAFQSIAKKTKLALVNSGAISIWDLPGVDGDVGWAFRYMKSVGPNLQHLDLEKHKSKWLYYGHTGIPNSNLRDDEITKIVKYCPNIKLIKSSDLSDKSIIELAKLKQLRSLEIWRLPDSLNQLDQLEELVVHRTAHHKLGKLINLKKLTINAYSLKGLDNLINLEELDITLFNNSVLPSLNNLVKLKTLRIVGIGQLPALDKLVNLEKLTLFCPPHLQDFSFLSRLCKLQELSIISKVRQKMPALDHLPALKEFYRSDYFYYVS